MLEPRDCDFEPPITVAPGRLFGTTDRRARHLTGARGSDEDEKRQGVNTRNAMERRAPVHGRRV